MEQLPCRLDGESKHHRMEHLPWKRSFIASDTHTHTQFSSNSIDWKVIDSIKANSLSVVSEALADGESQSDAEIISGWTNPSAAISREIQFHRIRPTLKHNCVIIMKLLRWTVRNMSTDASIKPRALCKLLHRKNSTFIAAFLLSFARIKRASIKSLLSFDVRFVKLLSPFHDRQVYRVRSFDASKSKQKRQRKSSFQRHETNLRKFSVNKRAVMCLTNFQARATSASNKLDWHWKLPRIYDAECLVIEAGARVSGKFSISFLKKTESHES